MGGAKNCPETPRQKMIGMMYLVLTAMLALNVSTDILNGFRLVDDSMHFTLDATEIRNKEMMQDFQAAAELNEQKNGEWYHKAQLLQQKADSIYNYIEDFKSNIAILADGKDFKKFLEENPGVGARVTNINARDQLDVTAQYALNEGHGEVLKNMFVDYREFLIDLTKNARFPQGEKYTEFQQMFSVAGGVNADGDSITWEQIIFEGMPVGASITVLSKMQLDIRSAQSEMILYLRDQTDAGDIRANKLEAFVVPNSRNVIRGGKYVANIVLAAIDSTAKPDYYVDGQKIGSDGRYEVLATGLGLKKYKGELVLPSAVEGEPPITIPFESDYSVMEPSVTIANTDLNIMYSEYDNKFSISVPGIPNDKVKVSVSGASAQQRSGMWIINPSANAKEVSISVSAEVDGKMQSMGTSKYRVKPKPNPSVYFKTGNSEIESGKVSRNAILNPASTVVASYGPDGLLELKYTVTSFTLMVNNIGTQSNGNKFTKQQIEQLSKLKQGSTINIVDVKVKDEKGVPLKKNIGGIMLILN